MSQIQMCFIGDTMEDVVSGINAFLSNQTVEKPTRKAKTKAVTGSATAPVEQQAELSFQETETNPAVTVETVEQQPADNTPQNATDLMAAVMPLVAGDPAKKIKLVKLLEEYKAKTINTLAQEHYFDFWAKVQEL